MICFVRRHNKRFLFSTGEEWLAHCLCYSSECESMSVQFHTRCDTANALAVFMIKPAGTEARIAEKHVCLSGGFVANYLRNAFLLYFS